MKLPKQVAPVERTLTPSAISGQSGVEASAWYDTLLDIAKKAVPIVSNVLGSL
ncbi:conserved hypothetical protein [Planktothrix serta PCC 8927]|uniref:Uncharacterized protein n=2 Tax=Planktothrix TaxID=54304 RepID=A0A7Z9DXR0_9CYAN|nr:conserved hypothetical protein [Planktothrix serta PCC 8927]